jgi:hypothetical protein
MCCDDLFWGFVLVAWFFIIFVKLWGLKMRYGIRPIDILMWPMPMGRKGG